MRNNVANNSQGRLRWINISVTNQELFQDVVLYGAGHLRLFYTLLFCGNNVPCKNRQHSAVHRHGNRNLVEGNTIEQNLHILNRVNRHTRLADVMCDALMIRVIATVCCQVKGNRYTLPALSQQLAVEHVGFFGR